MTPIEALELSELHVLDGAMATELEQRGCNISGPLWSAHALRNSPACVSAVHESYLEAGADCLLTSSYQISFEGFGELGIPPEAVTDSLRESVRLAELACEHYPGRHILIAASLGAYGAALHNGAEYHGIYECTHDDLVRFHARRLEALQTTNADLIAFETIPSLQEAQAIVAALHLYPALGAWVSFTCRDGRHVAHGELLTDCAALLQNERQVVAIAINCTPPHFISELIGELRKATTKPIFVYPNSGEAWDAEGRCWRGHSSTTNFGDMARDWFKAGAQAVGGCCRTGPEHVRAIRAVLS